MVSRPFDVIGYYLRRILYSSCNRVLGFCFKQDFFSRKCLFVLSAYRYLHNYVDLEILSSVKSIRYILELERGECSISVTDTGGVQLYIGEKLFLFPGGARSRSGLELHYENWSFIRNSAVALVADYELVRFSSGDCTYYQTERLLPWRDNHLELESILQSLNGCACGFRGVGSRLHIGRALALQYFDVDFGFVLEDGFLKSTGFRTSYMHGDLTPNNILFSRKGRAVLIDWDRFERDGWDGFDRLHYNVEFTAAREKKNWFSVVEDAFLFLLTSRDVTACNYYYYFLYRVSFEIGPNRKPSYRYQILAASLAQKLSDNFGRIREFNES